MKRASIAELKARLSEFVAIAKAGEVVVVTDRGRPVPRLAPLDASTAADARMDELIRTGILVCCRSQRIEHIRHRIETGTLTCRAKSTAGLKSALGMK